MIKRLYVALEALDGILYRSDCVFQGACVDLQAFHLSPNYRILQGIDLPVEPVVRVSQVRDACFDLGQVPFLQEKGWKIWESPGVDGGFSTVHPRYG